MQAQNLLLARRYSERSDRAHNGRVVTMRSNLRWCSDGFEFTCWNGDMVRNAVIIDAHDREIISWCAVVNAGISGSDVRDMMLAAVEARLRGYRAPNEVEMFSDNGSPYIARETCIFASQYAFVRCISQVLTASEIAPSDRSRLHPLLFPAVAKAIRNGFSPNVSAKLTSVVTNCKKPRVSAGSERLTTLGDLVAGTGFEPVTFRL